VVTWDVSPILIELGPLAIRWYGFLFALGFIVALTFYKKMLKNEKIPVAEGDAVFFYIIIATIVGARLGHCLFYEPEYYLSHPLEIFMVWKGGLASHGGTAAVVFAIYLYSRKRPQQPFLSVLDRISAPTAFVSGMIRMGNLFNSEMIGKPTDLPWAIKFVQIDEIPRHPGQLYEAISYFLISALLFWIYWRKKPKLPPQGLMVGIFLATLFGARILIEFFKINQVGFEESLTASVGLNLGQLLSIPAVLIGLALIVRSFSQKKDVPSKKTKKKK